MSTATKTDPQSPALHIADSHDLIRVQEIGRASCRERVLDHV